MVHSILRLVIISVLLLCFMPQVLAGKANEESPINSETLSGGVIQSQGYYLPRSMKIPVELRSPIDTRINKASDMVTVQVTEDVLMGDYVIIPANTFMHGYIEELKGPGRFHKAPKVSLAFDSMSLPGKNGTRRMVPIKGSVQQSAVLKSSERVNNGGMKFKKKAMVAAGLGGATGGIMGYAFTELVEPFQALYIEGLLNKAIMGGAALGGAYLASNLITKDDIRIEPGTKLDVFLEAPTMESFPEQHPLSHNQVKELSPEEAYDRYDEMVSQPLN